MNTYIVDTDIPNHYDPRYAGTTYHETAARTEKKAISNIRFRLGRRVDQTNYWKVRKSA